MLNLYHLSTSVTVIAYKMHYNILKERQFSVNYIWKNLVTPFPHTYCMYSIHYISI